VNSGYLERISKSRIRDTENLLQCAQMVMGNGRFCQMALTPIMLSGNDTSEMAGVHTI
jgi:hypothetical protein